MFVVPMSRSAFPFQRAFDHLFSEAAYERCAAATAAATSATSATATPTAAASAEPLPTRNPTLEVSESDRAYTVTLEMPGIGKDDIKVAIDGRLVSVEAAPTRAASGTAQAGATGAADAPAATGTDSAERVIYREHSAGQNAARYARRFTLPRELDQTASVAKMEHGVLTLTLAKRGAQAANLTVN